MIFFCGLAIVSGGSNELFYMLLADSDVSEPFSKVIKVYREFKHIKQRFPYQQKTINETFRKTRGFLSFKNKLF